MSDPVTPSAQPVVHLTFDEAVSIAEALGSAASAINPAWAGAIAAITGLSSLLSKTLIPAIQHARDVQMSVAQQAQLAADSALERARVGAPPAVTN